jgi:histidyl-tRNA synthetase
MGGGRYDNLLGVYGRADYATGISIGIERLIMLSSEKSDKKKTMTAVFIANVKDEFYKDALDLAKKLREEGIKCETDINFRNLRKQLDYVNVVAIPFAIIIGQQEKETGKYKLKNMKTGEEKLMDEQDLIEFLEE